MVDKLRDLVMHHSPNASVLARMRICFTSKRAMDYVCATHGQIRVEIATHQVDRALFTRYETIDQHDADEAINA